MTGAARTRGVLAAAFVLFLLCSLLYGETGVVLRGGIMKEMTDFEKGVNETVIKGGALFSVDDIYRFNCTYMRKMDGGESAVTWYMQGGGAERPWEFVLGSYNLHYGTGIVMGRKEYMRPDPFSRKLGFSRDEPYSPSGGGNPAYSFFGITGYVGMSGDSYEIRAVPFYSIQRRFIKQQDAASGSVASSLYTVNLRTEKEGEYVSPADIKTAGGALCAEMANLFHVQLYGFSTSLVSVSGDRILWESGAAGEGTAGAGTWGVFAEYSDESISLFAEHDTVIRENSGDDVTGGCTAFGLSFRNEIFTFGFSGKFSGKNFRSAQGSGDSGAEDVIESGGSVTWKHFAAGAAFYSEKDLAASPGSDERRCFMREEVNCALRGFDLLGAEVMFSRKRPLHGESDGQARQCSAGISFTPHKSFYLRARGTGQFNSAGSSYLGSGDMKIMFLEYFSLSAGYMYVYAAAGNPIYAVISPAAENTMDINRFVSRGNGCAVKLKYGKERDSFYLRWSRLSADGKVGYNAESALVLVF